MIDRETPVAFMFKVRTGGTRRPVLQEFAAIDYIETGDDEVIEKRPLYTRPQPAIPPVLFDGYAVYQALGNAQAKTSPKNVSDVLDAVVRLIRAEAPEATK